LFCKDNQANIVSLFRPISENNIAEPAAAAAAAASGKYFFHFLLRNRFFSID